jgi:hydroxypyruvate isomerase
MPKLAANLTMMFNEVPFLDRFEQAARAGFKGVEYLFPYEFPAAQILERLQRHNLEQVLFDLPAGDWAKGDRGNAIFPARKAEFQDGVGKALEYAKALGCRRLTVLAGKQPGDIPIERLHQTYVENLKYAAAQAAPLGISLMVEAINTRDIPGFFVNRTAHALQVMKDAGAGNIALQYDIYHMQIMEGDLATAIKTNLPSIGHMQLADNPGRNEPGTGEINYGFLLPHIDSLGYDGWIGCEYRPKGNTVQGLGWARQWLR